MLGTGRIYKLQINTFVDERRDPLASTYAAAKFLKDLYNIYGDWVLALAAYNCGPGNVNKAIRRAGGKTSYWEIYPYLPRETRGYVPAYIGATYAMTYYKEYGITPRTINVPPVSDTIMVNRNVNLAQVSEVLDIPLQLLRDLNPQYLRDILPGNSAPYTLRLPAMYATKYIDMEQTICNYKPEIYLSNSFRVTEPVVSSKSGSSSKSSGSSSKATAGTAGKDVIMHTIRSGETLGSIAGKYGVTTSNIQNWNNMSSSRIVAGKQLKIYTNPKAAPASSSSTANSAPSSSSSTGNNVTYYTVKKGDSIWAIAQKYDGVSESDIMKWNSLKAGSKITPGMKLKIIR
jgi:membrane-bound lytic murein transglycosylase D